MYPISIGILAALTIALTLKVLGYDLSSLERLVAILGGSVVILSFGDLLSRISGDAKKILEELKKMNAKE